MSLTKYSSSVFTSPSSSQVFVPLGRQPLVFARILNVTYRRIFTLCVIVSCSQVPSPSFTQEMPCVTFTLATPRASHSSEPFNSPVVFSPSLSLSVMGTANVRKYSSFASP